MATNVIGLDIGGANLKAATAQGEMRYRPFQLWKHPDRLAEALQELLADWKPADLAVTMTGELCDCFETKRDGVRRILAEVERAFPKTTMRVWSTTGAFFKPDEARHEVLAVAASNWHALATLAGRCLATEGPALIIDVGSTTTDIIPLCNGTPIPAGRTDPERLKSKELVYTGVKRTPVCALLQEGLMAELFATTLDAYIRIGLLPPDPHDYHTADGRPAVAPYAHARLARMLGGDSQITSEAETYQLGLMVYEKQRSLIVDALRIVADRLPRPPRTVAIFGSGEFLARAAWIDYAATVDRDTAEPMQLVSLAEKFTPEVSTAACAYAVAVLAEEQCP